MVGGGGGRRGGEREGERLNYEGDTLFYLITLGENRVKFKGSSRVGLSWGMVHEDTQMKVCSTRPLKLCMVLLSLRRLSLHEQNCLTDSLATLQITKPGEGRERRAMIINA